MHCLYGEDSIILDPFVSGKALALNLRDFKTTVSSQDLLLFYSCHSRFQYGGSVVAMTDKEMPYTYKPGKGQIVTS